MGYFSNGEEGRSYEEQWCDRCIHNPMKCSVWELHFIYNYDQHGKTPRSKTIKELLDTLIPRDKKGFNKKCTMFKRKRKVLVHGSKTKEN